MGTHLHKIPYFFILKFRIFSTILGMQKNHSDNHQFYVPDASSPTTRPFRHVFPILGHLFHNKIATWAHICTKSRIFSFWNSGFFAISKNPSGYSSIYIPYTSTPKISPFGHVLAILDHICIQKSQHGHTFAHNHVFCHFEIPHFFHNFGNAEKSFG